MCVAMRTKCNDKTFYSRSFDSFLYQKLKEISPLFENRLHFTQDRLENFDAVIATGSNNAAAILNIILPKFLILFVKIAMELQY